MNNILDVFWAPAKAFALLKDNPRWQKPLVIVIIAIILLTLLTMVLARPYIRAEQENTMRDRGMTDEEVEQAMQVAGSPVVLILGAVFAPVAIVALMLIFAVVLNLLIPLFGGNASFVHVFSVVCTAALVKPVSSLVRLVLTVVSRSVQVSTSLTLLTPNLPRTSFRYQLLGSFDVFIIWEMVLVAMGLTVTSGLKKNRSYILVFAVWLISVLLGIGLARVFAPSVQVGG